MHIDAEEFPSYLQAAAEVRRWLDETGEHHLYPGKALRAQKRECDGGPGEMCEGQCPRDEGPEDHTVEHEVWMFHLRERKGRECGDG
jgi:hypothetical protein